MNGLFFLNEQNSSPKDLIYFKSQCQSDIIDNAIYPIAIDNINKGNVISLNNGMKMYFICLVFKLFLKVTSQLNHPAKRTELGSWFYYVLV